MTDEEKTERSWSLLNCPFSGNTQGSVLPALGWPRRASSWPLSLTVLSCSSLIPWLCRPDVLQAPACAPPSTPWLSLYIISQHGTPHVLIAQHAFQIFVCLLLQDLWGQTFLYILHLAVSPAPGTVPGTLMLGSCQFTEGLRPPKAVLCTVLAVSRFHRWSTWACQFKKVWGLLLDSQQIYTFNLNRNIFARLSLSAQRRVQPSIYSIF